MIANTNRRNPFLKNQYDNSERREWVKRYAQNYGNNAPEAVSRNFAGPFGRPCRARGGSTAACATALVALDQVRNRPDIAGDTKQI